MTTQSRGANPVSYRIQGDVLIVISMALFGSYGIFLQIFPNIPILLFLFSFQAVGYAALFSWLFVKRVSIFKNINKSTVVLIIALAVSAVTNDLAFFASYRLTTIANASLSHQMVSFFLVILAPFLISERARKKEGIAFVIALIGVCLIFGQEFAVNNSRDIAGLIFGLISALCYAFMIMCYRILGRKNISISILNFWRYCFSSIIVLPFIAFGALNNFQTNFLIPLLGFGLIFAVIASGLHTLGMMNSRALHASVIGKSEPVFAIIFGCIFFHQVPSILVLVGGLLIIGSSIWLAIVDQV